MKNLLVSALLAISFSSYSQYRLGVSKEDIKAECPSCVFKETVQNGRTLLVLEGPNGTVYYDFSDDDGLSSSTKLYCNSYHAKLYMEDYDRQYKIITPGLVWEQVLDRDVSVIVEFFKNGNESYFHYKFKIKQ